MTNTSVILFVAMLHAIALSSGAYLCPSYTSSLTSKCTYGRSLGSHCHFSCDLDYDLHGSSYSDCVDDNDATPVWIPPIPTCTLSMRRLAWKIFVGIMSPICLVLLVCVVYKFRPEIKERFTPCYVWVGIRLHRIWFGLTGKTGSTSVASGARTNRLLTEDPVKFIASTGTVELPATSSQNPSPRDVVDEASASSSSSNQLLAPTTSKSHSQRFATPVTVLEDIIETAEDA